MLGTSLQRQAAIAKYKANNIGDNGIELIKQLLWPKLQDGCGSHGLFPKTNPLIYDFEDEIETGRAPCTGQYKDVNPDCWD